MNARFAIALGIVLAATAPWAIAAADPDNPCLPVKHPTPHVRAGDRLRYVSTIPPSVYGRCFPRYGWLRETDEPNAVALSSDGKTLAYSRGDSTIGIYAMPKGQLVQTLSGNSIPQDQVTHETIALSPDGSLIAAGGYGAQVGPQVDWNFLDARVTRLWLRSRPQPVFENENIAPDEIAFSADGMQFAQVTPLTHVDFNPKIRAMAWIVSTRTKTVRAWNPRSKCSSGYPNSASETGLIAFANGAVQVLDAGPDCTSSDEHTYPRLWTSRGMSTFRGSPLGTETLIALTPDDKTLVTASEKRIEIWSVGARRLRSTSAAAPCGKIGAVAVTNRAAIGLCSFNDSYKLVAWNVATGRVVASTAARSTTLSSNRNDRPVLLAAGPSVYVVVPDGIDEWHLTLP